MPRGIVRPWIMAAALLGPPACGGAPSEGASTQGGGGATETATSGGGAPASSASSSGGEGEGGGEPEPPCDPLVGVVAPTEFSRSIAIDATYVFWTGDGTVTRMPRCGGPIVDLYAGVSTDHLVVHGDQLYWVESNDAWAEGVIYRKGASDLSAPKVVAKNLIAPNGIAVDAEAVYFASYNRVKKVQHGTTVPVELTAEPTGAGGFNIAVDDEYVYFFAGAGIARVSKQGGDPELLVADADPFGWCLAVDDAHVYWTTYSNASGTLHRATKSGGEPEALHETTSQRCLSVDATHVVWTGKGVFSAEKKSFAPTQLSEIPGTYVAMDDRTIYWTTGNTVRAQAR